MIAGILNITSSATYKNILCKRIYIKHEKESLKSHHNTKRGTTKIHADQCHHFTTKNNSIRLQYVVRWLILLDDKNPFGMCANIHAKHLCNPMQTYEYNCPIEMLYGFSDCGLLHKPSTIFGWIIACVKCVRDEKFSTWLNTQHKIKGFSMEFPFRNDPLT